ncbi:hypothetical protein D3C87_1622480 [compost metagenome]
MPGQVVVSERTDPRRRQGQTVLPRECLHQPLLGGAVGDESPGWLQVAGDGQIEAKNHFCTGGRLVFDGARGGAIAAQKGTEAFQRTHAVIQRAQCQRDADWSGNVQAEKVSVGNLHIAPGAQAQIDRIQHRGFPAVARADQAIDARRWTPHQLLDATEIGDLDLSYSCHWAPL